MGNLQDQGTYLDQNPFLRDKFPIGLEFQYGYSLGNHVEQFALPKKQPRSDLGLQWWTKLDEEAYPGQACRQVFCTILGNQ